MKFLRDFLDKQKPNFEKGGKLEKFRSVFGGFETFLFVPNHTTKTGAHIRDAVDLKRTMICVVLALVPALLFGMYNVGYQHFVATTGINGVGFCEIFFYGFLKVLPMLIVSYGVGLGIEFTTAQIKGHEIHEGFLVSGMIIPMIMPVEAPLWMIAVSTAFAVIIGKEIFGGTGMNIWNPALIARAFFFFAYPSMISGDKVWVASSGVDTITKATPLAEMALGQAPVYSTADMFWGFIPGSIGETSTFAILLGAVLLLITNVASWRTMFSVFVGGFITALAFQGLTGVSAIQQLCIGGFAFGAVFMATDPVTSAQTNKGKYIYGFLIGMMAIVIRCINPGYPEGMMLAILLMNTFAPTIDWCVVQSNINRRLKRAKTSINN